MIKRKTIYTLIKKDVPIISGKNIIYDARVGGEKLVYRTISYPVRVYKLFNLCEIAIPLFFYRKRDKKVAVDYQTSTVVYLRPFKKNWSPRKDRLPFHLWGKKDHPLTKLWVELEYDYEDITKSTPLIRERLDDNIDQSLIKFLRQHEEKFTLIK